MKNLQPANAKSLYRRYMASTDRTLSDVYESYSVAKGNAYQHCINLMNRVNGRDLKIVSSNTFMFTVGFVNDDNFYYITPNYDSVFPLDRLEM